MTNQRHQQRDNLHIIIIQIETTTKRIHADR